MTTKSSKKRSRVVSEIIAYQAIGQSVEEYRKNGIQITVYLYCDSLVENSTRTDSCTGTTVQLAHIKWCVFLVVLVSCGYVQAI